jgi:adenosine deaminase
VATPNNGRSLASLGTRREILRRLPKAELHCHLDGSVRPQTLLDLAREYGTTMPKTDPRALAEYMRVDDARNLEDYLSRFVTTLSVMQTAPAMERIAYELAEDAFNEGVRYIETRFCPTLNVHGGLKIDEVVSAAARGLNRAERELGVVGRVIVTALRNNSPAESVALAELAVAMRGSGVVGFDLAGGEKGFPAKDHRDAFALALRHGMACTCHAGEGFGPESVRQAVYECHAQRLGHATHLIQDKALTEEVRREGIALEICLTSNVQTRAASSYADHPLRQYYERGMTVVLNTDNRLMSGVNLTDEYEHAANEIGFSFDELSEIALNGFASAFVDQATRDRLMASARSTIAALAKEVAA